MDREHIHFRLKPRVAVRGSRWHALIKHSYRAEGGGRMKEKEREREKKYGILLFIYYKHAV